MQNSRLPLIFAILALNAAGAACAQADEKQDPKPQSAVVAQPKAAVDPVARQDAAPPPLSAYIGKYPFDEVQGVTFFQHPVVRAAIVASGVDRDIQRVLVFDDTVVGPITETKGRLLVHGYDPVGAGVVNWAILLVADGSKAAVCYSQGVEKDVRGADWYFEGQLAFTLYDPCPSEEGDMETLSNWPVGPIPG